VAQIGLAASLLSALDLLDSLFGAGKNLFRRSTCASIELLESRSDLKAKRFAGLQQSQPFRQDVSFVEKPPLGN